MYLAMHLVLRLVPLIGLIISNILQIVNTKEEVSASEIGINALAMAILLIMCTIYVILHKENLEEVGKAIFACCIIYAVPLTTLVLTFCGDRNLALSIISLFVCSVVLLLLVCSALRSTSSSQN